MFQSGLILSHSETWKTLRIFIIFYVTSIHARWIDRKKWKKKKKKMVRGNCVLKNNKVSGSGIKNIIYREQCVENTRRGYELFRKTNSVCEVKS